MKTCIIVNTQSGRGDAARILDSVKPKLESKFGPCVVIEHLLRTYDPQIEKLLTERTSRYIVIGGDGTLHRLINLLTPRLLQKKISPIELALISSGTGCDFSRNFHKNVSVKNELSAILDGRCVPLDVGEVNLDKLAPTYFINSLSVGIGSEALSKMTAWHKKYLPTKLSYLVPGVMAFLSHKPKPFNLLADGKKMTTDRSLGIMVYNGQYSGGGMRWSKNASVSDGQLQLLVLPEVHKINILPAIAKILSDRIDEIEGFYETAVTSANLKLTDGGFFKIEMDGELFEAAALDIRVLSGIFQFRV